MVVYASKAIAATEKRGYEQETIVSGLRDSEDTQTPNDDQRKTSRQTRMENVPFLGWNDFDYTTLKLHGSTLLVYPSKSLNSSKDGLKMGTPLKATGLSSGLK